MIIVLLFTLGSLAISFIIPKGEISLVAGVMDAFLSFSNHLTFHGLLLF